VPGRDVPVYRMWDARAADTNHRYTTNAAIRAQMVAKGWVAEGYGPDQIIMCAAPPVNLDTTVRVTGSTPLALGCDGVAATGTLYAGAEVEPMIARDPTNPTHLIGVWQQDRWSDGGAAGQFTGLSFDGGRTWSSTSAPLSRCTGGNAVNGGDYPRISDSWITIAPDGAAYQSGIVFGGDTFTPNALSAIVVSRSADGGRSWGAATAVISDGSQFFNDKDSITADSTNAQYVYATWDRLVGSEDGSGPTWLARTTNGGASWEAARSIYDPGPMNQTINNQVVVLPDGTLVLFFSEFDTVGTQTTVQLRVIRSQDKGATWSPPVTIAQSQALGARWPETGEAIRDSANLGSIAVGKQGLLAVAWQDSRFSGGVRDGIAVSLSQDGGLTWSSPRQVNGAPGVQALLPTVTIRDDGAVGVTYDDFRNHAASALTLLTDTWLVTSADGISWRESHVAGPFDLAAAPFAEGLFLGDYLALTSVGDTFVSFNVTSNANSPTNLTDVYSTLVTIPAQDSTILGSAALDRVPEMSAVPAREMTSGLAQRLSDAAQRALQRRWAARMGPNSLRGAGGQPASAHAKERVQFLP
jgi:BNR repeat-like domain